MEGYHASSKKIGFPSDINFGVLIFDAYKRKKQKVQTLKKRIAFFEITISQDFWSSDIYTFIAKLTGFRFKISRKEINTIHEVSE